MPEARRVLVLGAGGHAKVVIELLREAPQSWDVVALLDRDPTPRSVLGVPVVGDDSRLEELRREGLGHAAVALGDNAVRQALGERAAKLGFSLVSALSARASISPTAKLGDGVAVMAGAVVNAEAALGRLAIVNSGAVVEHDAVLGAFAHLGPRGVLAGGAAAGERAFLGAGVTVIPGVRIGRDAKIGAGACVVHDIPDGVLALGVPARIVRSLEANS